LPVTGSNVAWIMALSGLVLVTLGAIMIWFMRPRRHSTA
jgi:LPXTG-motif cell wall-anchored protein